MPRNNVNVFFFFFSDLIHCTNEPNVSIPHLANLLVERSQNTNWIVVFKALITVHHLMCYGNEVSIIHFTCFAIDYNSTTFRLRFTGC